MKTFARHLSGALCAWLSTKGLHLPPDETAAIMLAVYAVVEKSLKKLPGWDE